MEAIAYARKHLAPLSETNMPQIQVAMATIAFGKDTTCEKYAVIIKKILHCFLISRNCFQKANGCR